MLGGNLARISNSQLVEWVCTDSFDVGLGVSSNMPVFSLLTAESIFADYFQVLQRLNSLSIDCLENTYSIVNTIPPKNVEASVEKLIDMLVNNMPSFSYAFEEIDFSSDVALEALCQAVQKMVDRDFSYRGYAKVWVKRTFGDLIKDLVLKSYSCAALHFDTRFSLGLKNPAFDSRGQACDTKDGVGIGFYLSGKEVGLVSLSELNRAGDLICSCATLAEERKNSLYCWNSLRLFLLLASCKVYDADIVPTVFSTRDCKPMFDQGIIIPPLRGLKWKDVMQFIPGYHVKGSSISDTYVVPSVVTTTLVDSKCLHVNLPMTKMLHITTSDVFIHTVIEDSDDLF